MKDDNLKDEMNEMNSYDAIKSSACSRLEAMGQLKVLTSFNQK